MEVFTCAERKGRFLRSICSVTSAVAPRYRAAEQVKAEKQLDC